MHNNSSNGFNETVHLQVYEMSRNYSCKQYYYIIITLLQCIFSFAKILSSFNRDSIAPQISKLYI